MSTTYKKVNEQIKELLEQENLFWVRTWKTPLPYNLKTKHKYTGINCLYLLTAAKDYRFLTFKQTKELGGYVKKGSKGYRVIYWNCLKKIAAQEAEDTEDTEEIKIPFLRSYTVFSFDQIEGIEDKEAPTFSIEPKCKKAKEAIERYCQKFGIKIEQNILKNAYYPEKRTIGIFPQDTFQSFEDYLATLFHEAVHSTAHFMNRKLSREQDKYAKEELVAELGASYLCAQFNISNESRRRNSAAYLQGWLEALNNDQSFFVKASAQAKKAVALILEGKGEN